MKNFYSNLAQFLGPLVFLGLIAFLVYLGWSSNPLPQPTTSHTTQSTAKYRLAILSAQIYPTKENNTCWDPCLGTTQKTMLELSNRLSKASDSEWKQIVSSADAQKLLQGFNLPDPYVAIRIDPKTYLRTSVQKNTIEPQWSYVRDVNLTLGQSIRIYVWDKDAVNDERMMMETVTIPDNYLREGGIWRLRFGQIRQLLLSIRPIAKPTTTSQPTTRSSFISGTYQIIIREASIAPTKENGASWDVMKGKPDPYAIVHIGQHRIQTGVIKDSFKPSWNYPQILKLDGTEDLRIEIWDQDMGQDDLIGKCEYPPLQRNQQIQNNIFRSSCQQAHDFQIEFKLVL
jgi:hypothetical protein